MPFSSITFAPLIPLWLFAFLASLAIGVCGINLVYGNKWAALCRLGAFGVILLWFANPQQKHKVWHTLSPTALVLVDNSPSMRLGERAALAQKAVHFLEKNHPPNLILHTVVVNDNGHEGTHLFSALQQASADIPPGHLAGVIMITDGENNDTPLSVSQILPQIIISNRHGQPFFLPLHILLTAPHEETDRRLSVLQAPPYALVGKTALIRLRVEDQGSSQKETPVTLTLRLNGAEPLTLPLHTGQSQEIHLPITHPGQNFVALSVSPLKGEVSTQNNQVIIPITGIRDRLRVLLISGSPNQEERSLRRFLKADPAVDLVHCTILRPPEKDDGTPLSDLALIAFPARELFEQKINQFNLIILDGFQNQFLFPETYFENIAQFVRNGGGLLLIAGPEFAGSNSLQNTPLGDILPAHVLEDARIIINRPFRPQLTEIGKRHPVTSLLPDSFSLSSFPHKNAPPLWGPWYRALQPDRVHGQILMTGPHKSPLLILDRVGKGRVAMLLSDQIWLWSRGEGGGGPYAELLRRLAHWLMKEPSLEEERLSAHITDNTLFITRHTLSSATQSFVTVTPPYGSPFRVRLTRPLQKDPQGIQQATLPIHANGIWQISDGVHTIYTASTQNNMPEFANLRATATRLSPLVKKTGGGIFWLGSLTNFHAPRIIEAQGSPLLHGTNWLAFPQRETRILTQETTTPLLPAWLPLGLVLAFLGAAWWPERHT